MNKIQKLAILSVLPVAAALISLPAQAEPLPSGCDSGIGYRHAYSWARCTTGGGYVRAVATCAKGTAKKKVYGPWKVNAGAPEDRQASAWCPSSHPRVVGHSYDIKR
ncbi:hypothetical protein ABZ297_28110 [Nonomuraea sp. NPDC005983]|uniref:hypothetical protein n=1 Tax=Nonomuraea sp. NPDC005983 TaxID=3155595 RepID=UPI0033A07C8E